MPPPSELRLLAWTRACKTLPLSTRRNQLLTSPALYHIEHPTCCCCTTAKKHSSCLKRSCQLLHQLTCLAKLDTNSHCLQLNSGHTPTLQQHVCRG